MEGVFLLSFLPMGGASGVAVGAAAPYALALATPAAPPL